MGTNAEPHIQWGAPVHGVRCGIRQVGADGPIPAGNPVLVEVFIENMGTEPVRLYGSTTHRDYRFTMIGPAKKPASPTDDRERKSLISSGSIFARMLAPGRQLAESFLLNRDFDMSQPGEYAIAVQHDVPATGPDHPQPDRPQDVVVSETIHLIVERPSARRTKSYSRNRDPRAESPASTETNIAWGRAVALLRCGVALESRESTFAACEPVRVRFLTENAGEQPVTTGSLPALSRYSIIVLGPDGQPVERTRQGRLRSLIAGNAKQTWQIPANAIESEVMLLNEEFDMTRAGEYMIQIQRRVPAAGHDSPTSPAVIESGTLVILITDPE